MTHNDTPATFKSIAHGAGAGSGSLPLALEFDIRPFLWNLERIAAAVEKIQLCVNVPEIQPQIHVTHPEVNVDVRPAGLTPTINVPATPPPSPVVNITMPAWPFVFLAVCTLLQLAYALGLFGPRG